MSLIDDFEAFERPPIKCKVCEWRKTVPDEVREFFDATGPVNTAKMSRFCGDRYGLKADPKTIRNHFTLRHVS